VEKTFEEALKELKNKHEVETGNLIRQFAWAQNPYKIGDVISDHRITIKIEKILATKENGKPTCVYKGPELKKDGTPKKKRGCDNVIMGMIWQINLF
jgi:hypothetical protein